MRPVSIVSSLPPKLTPSRTNIWSLLLRDPVWRFVPLLEGPAATRAARRPVRTPGKKDERRHRGHSLWPREPHARAATAPRREPLLLANTQRLTDRPVTVDV